MLMESNSYENKEMGNNGVKGDPFLIFKLFFQVELIKYIGLHKINL